MRGSLLSDEREECDPGGSITCNNKTHYCLGNHSGLRQRDEKSKEAGRGQVKKVFTLDLDFVLKGVGNTWQTDAQLFGFSEWSGLCPMPFSLPSRTFSSSPISGSDLPHAGPLPILQLNVASPPWAPIPLFPITPLLGTCIFVCTSLWPLWGQGLVPGLASNSDLRPLMLFLPQLTPQFGTLEQQRLLESDQTLCS